MLICGTSQVEPPVKSTVLVADLCLWQLPTYDDVDGDDVQGQREVKGFEIVLHFRSLLRLR